jgi:uncharacterized RDD family membrane protein YckC
MATPPKDPLAEHPLGSEPPARGSRQVGTLELFPEAADAPSPAVPVEPAVAAAPKAKARVPDGDEIDAPGELLDEGEPVSFTRRVVAGLADLLILALVGTVELTAGAFFLDLRFPLQALLGLGAFLLLVALVLLVLVPFVWGTTPGMALADLRIVARDGGSPTLASSLLRFGGFLLTCALAGVPLLVAAFDRRGRTLSDLLSGTLLTPVEKPSSVVV